MLLIPSVTAQGILKIIICFRMAALEKYSVVSSLKANNKIPVTKYRSERTGLTVTVAQVDGPVVNGYFCLATEAHDDDGLPHTLEHLIFLGRYRCFF